MDYATAISSVREAAGERPLVLVLEDFHAVKDPEFLGYAAVALGLLDCQPAAEPLLVKCRSRTITPTFRLQAATALGLLGEPDAVPVLSETLQTWLEWYPEKVLFGTDAFGFPHAPAPHWEERCWLDSRRARRALALALTRMVSQGQITRPRAEELARLVLRDNAAKLYGLENRR